MKIFVKREDRNFGPYTEEDARQYLAEGALSPLDLACLTGSEEWRQLGELLDFQEPAPPPPPVPVLAQSEPVHQVAPGDVAPAEPGAPGRLDVVAAIAFPFRERKALARIWWLPLIPFLPVFGTFILRGWRLDLVRRIGRRSPERVPDVKDFGRFISDGAVLVFMLFLYYMPLYVLLFFFGFNKVKAVLTGIWWATQTLFTDGAGSFWALVAELAVGVLLDLWLPIFYLIAVYPVYRMAVMRFALTGRVRSFFEIPRSLRRCWQLMPEMFLVFFVDFIALRIVRWIARALITFGVGIILAPLASALYFWTTGHLFGQVAEKLRGLEEVPAEPAEPEGQILKPVRA